MTGATSDRSVARLLVVANRFVQGHGGIPESILLLAQHLAGRGISTDVTSADGIFSSIEKFEDLPAERTQAGKQTTVSIGRYSGVLVAGSWNSRAIAMALRARLAHVPVTYAPKGNLCSIEFSRFRDLKKIPYFFTLEWIVLLCSRTAVFSSHAERDAMWGPARLLCRNSVVIPELFRRPAIVSEELGPGDQTEKPIVIGFLAEISPRKGLSELTSSFIAWLKETGRSDKLWIAGEPRPGSEGYADKIRRAIEDGPCPSSAMWLGPLRGARRDEFYRTIDVFACPSRFESFGLTALEALWHGVPVLAAPQLGVLEYLAADAAVVRMSGLATADIARGLDDVTRNLAALRNSARKQSGHSVLTLSAADIADRFAEVLLGPAPTCTEWQPAAR